MRPPQGSCPHCFETPDTFNLHESRKRSFRFIVGFFVRIVISMLIRWKCPICGRTFTDYPAFALPYKRYVLMDIEHLSEDYLENEKSYQQTVSCEGEAIGYEEKDGKVDERQLSASTPWRWLTFLGSMNNSLTQALNLIEQKAPQSAIFRQLFPLWPGKYRTQKRKILLQSAWKLLQASRLFEQLFGHKIFPRYEIVRTRI
ncbi:MAG: DUF6431 domain-containing protein [Candidatus Desantisbacteria bacterium]